MPDDDIERRIAEVLTRDRSSGLCPLDGPCTSCDCFDPLHEYERANAKAVVAEVVTPELIRLRNRIAALEASEAELLRRAEKAEAELAEAREWSTELGGHVTVLREMHRKAEAERDALKAAIEDLNWLMTAGRIVELLPLGDGVIALTMTCDPSDVQMQGALGEVLAKARAIAERAAALAATDSHESDCPTSCDEDCEAGSTHCAEVHVVRWQRGHDPENCPKDAPTEETDHG